MPDIRRKQHQRVVVTSRLEWEHEFDHMCNNNLWTEKSLREPFQQSALKHST